VDIRREFSLKKEANQRDTYRNKKEILYFKYKKTNIAKNKTHTKRKRNSYSN